MTAAAELCAEAEKLWAGTHADDLQRSLELFRQAYEQGDNRMSRYRLGCAYFSGRGVTKDLDKAYEFLTHAELDGMRYALYYRGLILQDPEFSGFNYPAALKVLKRAGELGVVQAAAPAAEVERRIACPLCGEKPTFEADTSTCPGCGLHPPHRVFALLYCERLSSNYGLDGARGLLVGEVRAAEEPRAIWGASYISAVKSADLAWLKGPFDFAVAEDLNDLRKLRALLRNEGVLFVPALVSGAPESVSQLLAGLQRSFEVQMFSGFDPWTGRKWKVLAGRKRLPARAKALARTQREFVTTAVRKNQENEARSGCAFSQEYEAYKASNPGTSYARFAVPLEADAVAKNLAHATLGTNISERAKEQGKSTFDLYRRILNVSPNDRVVEYGCGSLRVGRNFIEYLNEGNYFGLDVVSTFYDIGAATLGAEVLKLKRPQFGTLDSSGMARAEAFDATHVYCAAVIFHIHPDDIGEAGQRLASLAAKPGASLLFDAKLTRNNEPQRYEQNDKKGGWAWPVDFYSALLAPLELVGIHQRVPYRHAPDVDFAYMEFRRPYPQL